MVQRRRWAGGTVVYIWLDTFCDADAGAGAGAGSPRAVQADTRPGPAAPCGCDRRPQQQILVDLFAHHARGREAGAAIDFGCGAQLTQLAQLAQRGGQPVCVLYLSTYLSIVCLHRLHCLPCQSNGIEK